MTAGHEWDTADHAKRVAMYTSAGALSHHGAEFRAAEIGRPFAELDAVTQAKLHRAWVEEREHAATWHICAQEQWDGSEPAARAALCGEAGIGPAKKLTRLLFSQLDLECQRRLNVTYAKREITEIHSRDAEKKFTAEQIIELIGRDDSLGLCVECGEEAGGVEPDARRYRCECCGKMGVYGAEELLVMTQS